MNMDKKYACKNLAAILDLSDRSGRGDLHT